MFGLFRRKPDFDAVPSAEAQAYASEALAEWRAKQAALEREWRVGFQETWGFDQSEGVLRLEFQDGSQVMADIQILGTYSRADRSWEWAWNNPNVNRDLARASEAARALGKKLALSHLTAGMVPAPNEETVARLCSIGVKAAGAAGTFRGRASGAIEVVLLLDRLRVKRPETA